MTVLTVILVVSVALTTILLLSDSSRTRKRAESFSRSAISPEEAATRSLIGDRKYEAMSRQVSALLKRHANDKFRTVMLTAGSIDRNAMRTLHSLLPGDPVRLHDETSHGVADVGVYYGEERIGRLLLDDANEALEAIKGTLVTGAYIAEQNSYGEQSPEIAVKLIIFFTSMELPASHAEDPLKTPYKITYDGLRPIVIYQN